MNNTIRFLSSFIMFLIFIGCSEPESNRLSGTVKETPESTMERNIKKAYPGCQIFQYKDDDISTPRYLIITTDSIIIVIDGFDNNKYPFSQNIFITRL